MKRFLANVALFAAIQAPLFALFLGLYFGVHYEDDPMAAIVDKEQLLAATPSPRIVFVGDSGVPFGIVSPMVAEAFPGRHPVNMGLAAGFGHRVLLGETLPEIREGDVVVVCFVYEMFSRNLLNEFIFPLCAQDPDIMLSFNRDDWVIFGDKALYLMRIAMRHARKLVFTPLDTPGTQPYARSSYNEYGDIDAHYEMEPPPGRSRSVQHLDLGDLDYAREVVVALNEFAAECEARGAQVYFLFPAISEESYRAHRGEMDRLAALLEAELDPPLLNRPRETTLPEPSFFDTPYHLTGPAARQRTGLLIEALAPHLREVPKAEVVTP